jgi:hypothetical protein
MDHKHRAVYPADFINVIELVPRKNPPSRHDAISAHERAFENQASDILLARQLHRRAAAD